MIPYTHRYQYLYTKNQTLHNLMVMLVLLLILMMTNLKTAQTDDEVDSQPNHPIFYPIPDQNVQSGQPLLFDVKMSEEPQSPNLPLCLVMNCRSVYNKSRNLCELLSTIGPSLLILSETFERDKQPLQDLIKSKHYGTISCYKISHPVGGVL